MLLYQWAPKPVGAETIDVCLTCLLLCLTIPCTTRQRPCLHLLCVFVALLQLWIFFSSTAPQTTARILLPAWSHWCSRAGERSRAELPHALGWLEAVGPARGAHCMGSVFQEWREQQGFKLPDMLMLQTAVWFTGILLSLVRCTISSIVSKTERDVKSPLPPPLTATASWGDFPTHWVSVGWTFVLNCDETT